jgi:hypothetical protein
MDGRIEQQVRSHNLMVSSISCFQVSRQQKTLPALPPWPFMVSKILIIWESQQFGAVVRKGIPNNTKPVEEWKM